MNWGNRLLLVFIVFGGGISYMVYRCMQTPVDLVSTQYYKDELAYQRVIDGKRQADALSARPMLSRSGEGLRLQMPVEMKHREVRGTISFYCAADASRDREVALAPEPDGSQEIASAVVRPGHYVVKVNWTASGVGYFSEQPFVIR